MKALSASDKLPHLSYRFIEHALYLDEFIAEVVPKNQTVILVLHDWGSALGFHWARRNEHRLAGLAFMEFIPPMPTWVILDKGGMTSTFQAFRGPPEVGRKLLIEENVFVEKVLPGSVVRALTEKEMEHYRAPFLEPVDRDPVYGWPNEVRIEGKPADVIVDGIASLLFSTCPIFASPSSKLPRILFASAPSILQPLAFHNFYSSPFKLSVRPSGHICVTN